MLGLFRLGLDSGYFRCNAELNLLFESRIACAASLDSSMHTDNVAPRALLVSRALIALPAMIASPDLLASPALLEPRALLASRVCLHYQL